MNRFMTEPVMPPRASRELHTVLALIGLISTVVGCASATPAASVCPPQAAHTITQLYSWYIGAGDAYREHLDQQEDLFEPALYEDLQAAFRLQPPAESFLDIDPFNGAQVSSYGFRLVDCRASGDQLKARLLVKAGLGPGRTSERPIQVWLRRTDGAWRIGDLEYPPSSGQAGSRLKPLLRSLLSRDDQPSQDSADAASQASAGEELLTPSFRVVVERHCPEGTVVCDRVSYRGEDRETGAAISLTGSTEYHICADGQTPCRFLGYRFANGNVIYEVSEDGVLTVTQAGKVLLQEQGKWQR